jgi:hypothetical protein
MFFFESFASDETFILEILIFFPFFGGKRTTWRIRTISLSDAKVLFLYGSHYLPAL